MINIIKSILNSIIKDYWFMDDDYVLENKIVNYFRIYSGWYFIEDT